MLTILRCYFCEQELDDTDTYCPNCGLSIKNNDSENKKLDNPKTDGGEQDAVV